MYCKLNEAICLVTKFSFFFLASLTTQYCPQDGQYAPSFCMSKIILDRPNCFGQVQIILVGFRSFWSSPNHFVQVQIRLLWISFYDLEMTKTNWTCPKGLVVKHNDLDDTKSFWISRRTRHLIHQKKMLRNLKQGSLNNDNLT